MSTRGGWASRTETAGIASDFARGILVRQVSIGALATVLVMLIAPWMLMLDSEALGSMWARVLFSGAIGVGLAAALGAQTLRERRGTVQALTLEPERVDAAHVGLVAAVPRALTQRFLAAFGVASIVLGLPGLLPSATDAPRALGLAVLAFAVFSSAAVVHFVVVREVTVRVIELGPFEAISSWLEQESVRTPRKARVVRRMLLAIAVPVAVVGVGSVLVAQAHARAAAERERATLAEQVARVALDGLGGQSSTERDDALAAAAAFGFSVRTAEGALEREDPEWARVPGGMVELRARFDDATVNSAADGGAREPEHLQVRYGAVVSAGDSSGAAFVALAAVFIAALMGAALGWLLGSDLQIALRQVASLSTESVLRGKATVAGSARFALVAEIGDGVGALTERFREFAAAQERAFVAKASAQRMKQLLFASVSHDLKSPLNAIVGFSELLREEPLSPGQQESLGMVSGRARELLALIETILDAARVEAGQLKLSPEPLAARVLLDRALSKAFDLIGDRQAEVSVELAHDVPELRADPTRGPAALAVLLAHAMVDAAAGKHGVVRVRATGPSARGGMPRLHIEHATPRTRPSQLEEQLSGRSAKHAARGVALRLSLARAIVELHGGRVEVSRGPRGEAVLSCFWPSV